ncbi:hypothetical protein EZS27_024066 [termite gut metagenome]|uniref:Uncharacterized protein n=1 Tax=termite gut metagenome TaxID=433724 RepID=A0A5J4QZQ6_9ZZZZ
MKEKERYINSLIVPFHELSELFYPTLAPKERRNKWLKQLERSRNFWQQNTERKEAQEQLKAIEDSISEEVEQQERLEMISSRFFKIINKPQDDVEKALSDFCHIEHMFANRLDALCLVDGIDLMRLQRECGTYLITCRDITLLMDYIGSIELAQKYIDELPKEEYIEQSKQPQPEPADITRIHKTISDENIDILFDSLKKYIEPCDKNYFTFAFNGGTRPEGYNGMKIKKTLSDNLFVYLIHELFTDGSTTNWKVAHEFGIKDPDKKRNNYYNNNDSKPRGHALIDDILSQLK